MSFLYLHMKYLVFVLAVPIIVKKQVNYCNIVSKGETCSYMPFLNKVVPRGGSEGGISLSLLINFFART